MRGLSCRGEVRGWFVVCHRHWSCVKCELLTEVLLAHRMSKEYLKKLCTEMKQYGTPHLNDQL